MAKNVSKGQNVTFFCEGFGSSVNISWQFLDVCGDCGTVELDTTILTASSTLTIDTSQLAAGAYTLDCVIHQDVPVRAVEDKVFSAVLTVGKFYSTVTMQLRNKKMATCVDPTWNPQTMYILHATHTLNGRQHIGSLFIS